MLSDASAADGFSENIVTKEEIAQNEQFLLLTQCFPLLVIGYPFNYRVFNFLTKHVLSRLLQNCCMRERVNGWVIYAENKSGYDFFYFFKETFF